MLDASEAFACWQFFNYAEAEAGRRGRTLLRINLDETAVCLYPGRGRGAVFLTKKHLRDGGGQQVPRWKRRCNMTHIAVLCDRPDVQAVLPQFIVANERTLPARSLAALLHQCPPNVRLLRQASAWNTHALAARVIREVAAAIASQETVLDLHDVQVVFVMDCAKIHLHETVLRACKAARFWLIFVPPRMTPYLQPLDTHVFSVYKAILLVAYANARIRSRSQSGDLAIDEYLVCLFEAVRVLSDRAWTAAFDQDGLGLQQVALRASLRRQLQLDGAAIAVASTQPSDAQLRVSIPRNFRLATAVYWSLFAEVSSYGARAKRAAAPPRIRAVPALAAPGAPRGPRTRAEHRAAADAAAAAPAGPRR